MGKQSSEDTLIKVWSVLNDKVPLNVSEISKKAKVSWDSANAYCFTFWTMGIVIGFYFGDGKKVKFLKIPNLNRLQTIDINKIKQSKGADKGREK